ncbi:hypothetical protein SEA_NERGAL_58 [Mycobacterium Phage Nergal]|nr:hypothetical protein SEA_NERGAL_58 [Mycobacterium Phage Nergal]
MSNDSYDFLAGGGVPSGKFKAHGDTVGGPIAVEPSQTQQTNMDGDLLTWPDGSPRMQLVVTVQTDNRDPSIEDDDGKRRLFIKGEMKKAVQQAVIAAGARGLDVGGELHVTYVGDGEPARRGLTAPKLYQARYIKPSAAALATPAAAAAPTAAAAPANLPDGVTPEAWAELQKLGMVQ